MCSIVVVFSCLFLQELVFVQVQQNVLQKRREDKKASLEAIKRFRKGKGEKPSFLAANNDEDDFPVAAHQEAKEDKKGQKYEKSKKRQIRVSCDRLIFKVYCTLVD